MPSRLGASAAVVRGALAAVVGVATLAGCGLFGEDVTEPAPTAPASLTLTSSAFADGDPVPRRFTCDGDNISPPLAWTGVPADAGALAIVVADPDAPNGTFVHWVLFDVDPTVRSLSAGDVPAGSHQAKNSSGNSRYDGPCPPSGTHHYRFIVYALRTPTTLSNGVDMSRALAAIDGKAIGRGTLVGTYSRD